MDSGGKARIKGLRRQILWLERTGIKKLDKFLRRDNQSLFIHFEGKHKPGQHLVYASSDLSRLDILGLSRNPPVDF
jgi:hypothetical protein